jgi:hypothetical protein
MTNEQFLKLRRLLRRRARRDEVTVEWTCMGRVFTIPAEPRPLTIDLRADAPGWVPLSEFRRRSYR